jgi:hypothetical protein
MLGAKDVTGDAVEAESPGLRTIRSQATNRDPTVARDGIAFQGSRNDARIRIEKRFLQGRPPEELGWGRGYVAEILAGPRSDEPRFLAPRAKGSSAADVAGGLEFMEDLGHADSGSDFSHDLDATAAERPFLLQSASDRLPRRHRGSNMPREWLDEKKGGRVAPRRPTASAASESRIHPRGIEHI